MSSQDKDGLKARIYELCPEIEQLGLYTIVIGKGRRY